MRATNLFKQVTLLCLVTIGSGTAVAAENYPDRPITMIVPFTAGSSADMVARVAAEGMRDTLGQAVVVENRPGAAGNIGYAHVSNAKPDGYTVLLTLNTLATNPSVYKNVPYDAINSFAPIGLAAWASPITLVARSSLENISSVADLIAYAKENPGKLTYSSPGAGTPHHLSMELFKESAQLDILHVPHKSINDMIMSLARGDVDVTFLAAIQALPLAQDNKLKILGIDNEEPLSTSPEIPLFKEVGLPRFKFEPWYGALAPAGTPQTIIDKLNQSMNSSLERPEAVKTLAGAGLTVTTSTPQEFGQLIHDDLDRWSKVVRDAGISVN